MLKRFIVPALVLVAFVAGAAGGAYYHSELAVWWVNLFGTTEAPPAPAVLPAIDRATTSVIELPTLNDPLPLVYSETLDEPQLQEHLKSGAVVLPLGTSFGEPGNVVITAHSSGTEAFGPYRFAFAQLAELSEGDEYVITTPTAHYRYRVYATDIVWPHEVDRLPHDDRSTVTLVTCWPLWTNFQRLLVHTELMSVEYNI